MGVGGGVFCASSSIRHSSAIALVALATTRSSSHFNLTEKGEACVVGL